MGLGVTSTKPKRIDNVPSHSLSSVRIATLETTQVGVPRATGKREKYMYIYIYMLTPPPRTNLAMFQNSKIPKNSSQFFGNSKIPKGN